MSNLVDFTGGYVNGCWLPDHSGERLPVHNPATADVLATVGVMSIDQCIALTGVASDDSILCEEIFGLEAPIIVFDTDDEAVAMANDTESGLVAYLLTQSLQRGHEVSRKLQSEMIGLNKRFVSDPAAPFSGVKRSGIGREGAREGMLEFLETKYVASPYF